jgi:hypothetical protein
MGRGEKMKKRNQSRPRAELKKVVQERKEEEIEGTVRIGQRPWVQKNKKETGLGREERKKKKTIGPEKKDKEKEKSNGLDPLTKFGPKPISVQLLWTPRPNPKLLSTPEKPKPNPIWAPENPKPN